jgi:hypothetical protein
MLRSSASRLNLRRARPARRGMFMGSGLGPDGQPGKIGAPTYVATRVGHWGPCAAAGRGSSTTRSSVELGGYGG